MGGSLPNWENILSLVVVASVVDLKESAHSPEGNNTWARIL